MCELQEWRTTSMKVGWHMLNGNGSWSQTHANTMEEDITKTTCCNTIKERITTN